MMGLYVAILAAFVIVGLYVVLARTRSVAASVRKLAEQVGVLSGRVDAAERLSDASREGANTEQQARTDAKVDKTAAELKDLIERNRKETDAALRQLDLRIRAAGIEPGRPGAQAAENAARASVPGTEFGLGLAPTAYLAAETALSDSLGPPTAESLRKLKSDLQFGISRVERVESLLLKREGEERAVVGAAGDPAVPEEVSVEEAEFEEWEQEAKELAEGEEAEEEEVAATEPAREAPTEYPGEMGESGEEVQTELLEAELYEDEEDDEEVELPEIGDDEEPRAQ